MPNARLRTALAVLLTTLLCALVSAAAPADAQTLTVAAASDLQAALPRLVEQFRSATGHTATTVFGSSGNFYAQIQNGAPFDIFFSADIDYPKKLETARLTVPGSLYEYAAGRIVLWSRRDAGIDLSRGLAALDSPAVKRIAIANPEHAPYGRAAVAALQHEGLYEKVKAKLVLGENISQAVQFVSSGAADAGIVALSLTVTPEAKAAGTSVPIPPAFYPPIRQAAVVLASSRNKDLAQQFMEFLKTPAAVQTLADYGFTRP